MLYTCYICVYDYVLSNPTLRMTEMKTKTTKPQKSEITREIQPRTSQSLLPSSQLVTSFASALLHNSFCFRTWWTNLRSTLVKSLRTLIHTKSAIKPANSALVQCTSRTRWWFSRYFLTSQCFDWDDGENRSFSHIILNESLERDIQHIITCIIHQINRRNKTHYILWKRVVKISYKSVKIPSKERIEQLSRRWNSNQSWSWSRLVDDRYHIWPINQLFDQSINQSINLCLNHSIKLAHDQPATRSFYNDSTQS